MYQSFEIDDFTTNGLNPGSTAIPEVLTLFGTVPDYEVHTAMVFFPYRISASKK